LRFNDNGNLTYILAYSGIYRTCVVASIKNVTVVVDTVIEYSVCSRVAGGTTSQEADVKSRSGRLPIFRGSTTPALGDQSLWLRGGQT
jgi:hypothetical protein